MCREEADGYLQLFGRAAYHKETDNYMVIHANNAYECNVEAQRHCNIWPLDIMLTDFAIAPCGLLSISPISPLFY